MKTTVRPLASNEKQGTLGREGPNRGNVSGSSGTWLTNASLSCLALWTSRSATVDKIGAWSPGGYSFLHRHVRFRDSLSTAWGSTNGKANCWKLTRIHFSSVNAKLLRTMACATALVSRVQRECKRGGHTASVVFPGGSTLALPARHRDRHLDGQGFLLGGWDGQGRSPSKNP